MLRLLLTRPAAQSSAFAAALEARLPGRFAVVVSPLVAVVPRATRLDLDGIAALAFTSANGVAAYAALTTDRSRPAYCVGASTAAAAGAIGLDARSADGDAAALAALIARERPGPVLHLRGAEAAADLADLLPDLPVASRVLYDQVPVPPPADADARARAGRLDAVALFSPRSAARFAEVAAGHRWDLAATTTVTISPAADAALDGLTLGRRRVADRPSREAMLAALASL
jgi:uroporphyrinogen-III synthase